MSELSTEKIWSLVLQALRLLVSEGAYNTFLKQTNLISTTESSGRLICEIGCGSAYIKTTLEQRYWGQINSELERITEKKCEIMFKVEAQKAKLTETPGSFGPLFETPKNDGEWKRANLREDYTFDNYAVGGSNQMAFAAAQAVARKPGEAYNPLFIYGGVGVGKTHLMQAIGHDVLQKGERAVLFCTGEEFTNDLVEAIRFKSTEKVRVKYRKVKILMIDDVQFIAGKQGIQEEFFHTFNAIQREGGQVVMTSDKPPSEISKLEERLRSRFGAGLIVDVGQPDFELKTAILLIKAKQRQVELPMEVAQLIAENIDGVRELQGALTRLLTEADLKRVPISKELTEEFLRIKQATSNQSARIITPAEVMAVVGSYYNVGVQQLKGERRNKTVVWPRQILMYLLRSELKLPLEEVGRLIGGRDHTTVIHADEKVKRELVENAQLKNEVAEIKRKLLISS